jgi:hypothetical protein
MDLKKYTIILSILITLISITGCRIQDTPKENTMAEERDSEELIEFGDKFINALLIWDEDVLRDMVAINFHLDKDNVTIDTCVHQHTRETKDIEILKRDGNYAVITYYDFDRLINDSEARVYELNYIREVTIDISSMKIKNYYYSYSILRNYELELDEEGLLKHLPDEN